MQERKKYTAAWSISEYTWDSDCAPGLLSHLSSGLFLSVCLQSTICSYTNNDHLYFFICPFHTKRTKDVSVTHPCTHTKVHVKLNDQSTHLT